MNTLYKNIFALLALVMSLTGMAQVQRSQEFNDRYQLKEVVALSRHNIRSPLSGPESALGKMTPHAWTEWSAAPSELTERGGALETMMGQYFGKWLIAAGMFPVNYVPTADEVNIYANSMQRTIATAQYFSSGFMPVGGLTVYHRFAPSKMDPLFFPRLTKASEAFLQEAQKQIQATGGERGLEGYNEQIAPNYALLKEVLDVDQSPAAAANGGKFTAFDDFNSVVNLRLGEEPTTTAALKNANSASDAFILQYYEEPDLLKAGFGHNLTFEQWKQLAEIKDHYQDLLFSVPIVAVNVANPLVKYIYDELNADARKFTFLCGHDSNIGSVATALNIDIPHLPSAIEAKTPIGCKLVFEKWTEKATGEKYVAINIVYQSVDQLRNLTLLDMKNPPMVVPLTFTGLTPNADGLYKLSDVNMRFVETMAAYDAIPF